MLITEDPLRLNIAPPLTLNLLDKFFKKNKCKDYNLSAMQHPY